MLRALVRPLRSRMFHKLLIANRGEIACRVARAARLLGIRTVAVYSDPDEKSLHVEACDEAMRLGPGPARESHLDGMQVAADNAELVKALRACRDRARSSFGKDAVYLERYFPAPRHVEVQILGDGRLTLHLGARECSIQRRHQKILEEAPATAFLLPAPRPRLRDELLRAGLLAARAVGYANAGTCEFL